MKKQKQLLAVLAVACAGLAWVPFAHADLISIGLQETGVNSGSITTEATGSGAASITGLSYGTFTLNSAQAEDVAGLLLPDLLYSNSINTSSSTAGTLIVWITAQGLSQPAPGNGTVVHSYTVNPNPAGGFPSGWSVTLATYYSATNALYGGTPTGSATFTALGTDSNSTPVTFSGLFSVTQEYIITASAHGSVNSTINTAVPEPGSLGMFGAGLFGLGMIGWLRRRHKGHSA